ncbi:MAG TPA: hypothetical protein VNX68_08530, partial [Nitrosopumilaceae archaeon]|nr:hypothetical protein [Nitrosopumilaceae archaeon]
MKKILFTLVSFVLLFITTKATSFFYGHKVLTQPKEQKPPAPKWTSHKPFEQKIFIENKGQYALKNKATNTDILFGARQDGLQYFFAKDGIWIKYIEKIERTKREIEKFKEQIGEKENTDKDGEEKIDNVVKYKFVERFHRMEFIGAGASTTIIPEGEPLTQLYNFTIDNKTNVSAHAFKKITYKNLYQNIDMEIYFPEDKQGFKYNLILNPGADPNQIQIQYPLNTGISLSPEGNMIINSLIGDFTDHAPIATEENSSEPVKCSFLLDKHKRIVTFNLENYNTSKTLIIDPWTTTPTYAGNNNAYDVDWDNAGNCYAYGGTPPFQVIKFNNAGAI